MCVYCVRISWPCTDSSPLTCIGSTEGGWCVAVQFSNLSTSCGCVVSATPRQLDVRERPCICLRADLFWRRKFASIRIRSLYSPLLAARYTDWAIPTHDISLTFSIKELHQLKFVVLEFFVSFSSSCNSHQWARVSSLLKIHDHTQTHHSW